MRWLLLAVSAISLGACSGSTTTPTPTVIVAPPPVAPTPPPTEVPPAPIARFSVSVDRIGNAVAILGASTAVFDASNSSGTGLRYGIDYGDGQGVDGATTGTHSYAAVGTYHARLVVTDALGRTDSASADVIVRSIAGSWYNSIYNQNAKRYESRTLTISQSPGAQNGTAIAGDYRHPEGWTTPFNGLVGASRQVKVDLTDGTISMNGDGEHVDRYGASPDLTRIALLVRGGSADGLILTFTR